MVSERLERRPGPGSLSPLDVKSPTEDNHHRVESAARGKHQHTHTAKRDTGPQVVSAYFGPNPSLRHETLN